MEEEGGAFCLAPGEKKRSFKGGERVSLITIGPSQRSKRAAHCNERRSRKPEILLSRRRLVGPLKQKRAGGLLLKGVGAQKKRTRRTENT